MRIERELMKGAGPLAVLELLERRPMYGWELIEQLATKAGAVLKTGQSTLYPMLYNLEAKGFIRATWRDADSGRQRKYYALTAKGKKRLSTEMKQWRAVAGAMSAIGALPGTEGEAAAKGAIA